MSRVLKRLRRIGHHTEDSSDCEVILYDEEDSYIKIAPTKKTVFVFGTDEAPSDDYVMQNGSVLHRKGQYCTSIHARATKMKRRRRKTVLTTIRPKVIENCGICNRTK